MYLKKDKIKDRKYLDSFRDMPCLICGSRETTVAHHLRSDNDAGTGTKASDNHTIPLCHRHHEEIHKSEKDFCKKYEWAVGGNVIALAEMFYRRYLDSQSK